MIWAWKNGKNLQKKAVGNLGDIYCPNSTALQSLNYDYLTAFETFPAEPHRVQGLYFYGSAEGHLTLQEANIPFYGLTLKFTKVEDGQKLYNLFRAGEIQPHTSFEDPLEGEQDSPTEGRIVVGGKSSVPFKPENYPKDFTGLCILCEKKLTDDNSSELSRAHMVCSECFHRSSTDVYPPDEEPPEADDDEDDEGEGEEWKKGDTEE